MSELIVNTKYEKSELLKWPTIKTLCFEHVLICTLLLLYSKSHCRFMLWF